MKLIRESYPQVIWTEGGKRKIPQVNTQSIFAHYHKVNYSPQMRTAAGVEFEPTVKAENRKSDRQDLFPKSYKHSFPWSHSS